MSWLDSIRSAFSFLGSRNRAEDAMAQYVVREHHHGRPLGEILDDPFIVNRCSPEQIRRLLDRPEIVHALGESVVAEAKSRTS